jgi:hypothetical protein
MQILCIKHEYFTYIIQKQCFICLNIKNIKYVQILYILTITQNLRDFHMNLWKSDFAKKLYQLMKLNTFFMLMEEKTKNHQTCLQFTKYI